MPDPTCLGGRRAGWRGGKKKVGKARGHLSITPSDCAVLQSPALWPEWMGNESWVGGSSSTPQLGEAPSLQAE